MPGRRSRNSMGTGALAAKPTPVEAWEDEVFAQAVQFRAVKFLGRGQHERHEFTVEDFPKALAFARTPQPGKPYALYVVSAAGRSVCLEGSKDGHWKDLWMTHHKKTV